MRSLFFCWLCLLPLASVAQWVSVNDGLYGGQVVSLQTLDGNLYAGTPGGPYKSSDDGQTWEKIFTGLDVTSVNDLAVSGGKLLLAVNGGSRLFVTTDQGTSWQVSNTGLPPEAITELVVTPGYVFGQTGNGFLYRSADDGATWTNIDIGALQLRTLTASGNDIFLGTAGNGVYRSSDNGITFTPVNTGLGNTAIVHIMEAYEDFVIAWAESAIYMSADKGATWTNTGLPQGYLHFGGHGGTLIYSNESSAFRSTNNGVSWSPVPELAGAACLVWHDNAFIAGNYYGIYKSENDGVSWSVKNEGLTNASISGFAELNNKLFASAIGVFRSANQGNNWVKVSNGLPVKFTSALISNGNTLLVSFYEDGIYRSVNEGNTWTQVSTNILIRCFARKGSLLLAGGEYGFFVSADDGVTWNQRSTVEDIFALTVQGNRIFAGRTSGSMMLVSDDDGQTWTPAVTGLPPSYVFDESLFAHDGKVFVGPANSAIYSTANNGVSWQLATNGLAGTTRQVYSFGGQGTRVFTGTDSGVYFSDNGGASWTPMNDQLPIIDISNDVGKLFGGQKYLFSGHTHKGVWRWNPPCNLPTPVITVEVTATDTTLISSSSTGNQWYVNGDLIEGATDQTFSPVGSGTYTVIVTIDHCISVLSNAQLVTRTVIESLDPVIEMPNVFTPNGDNLNPAFVPMEFQDIPRAYLQIFDRWGKRVYATDNLTKGWDGGNYPAAVYYYLITYRTSNGTDRKVKGWVQLLR